MVNWLKCQASLSEERKDYDNHSDDNNKYNNTAFFGVARLGCWKK